MTSLLCVSVLIALVTMANASDHPDIVKYDITDAQSIFEKFIIDFHKTYKDEDDKKAHFEAFVENLKKINEMNEKNSTATFAINKFADFTSEERKTMFGRSRSESGFGGGARHKNNNNTLDTTVDKIGNQTGSAFISVLYYPLVSSFIILNPYFHVLNI